MHFKPHLSYGMKVNEVLIYRHVLIWASPLLKLCVGKMELTILALPICRFCQLSMPPSIAEIVPPALIPRGCSWTVSHIYGLVTIVTIHVSPANGSRLLQFTEVGSRDGCMAEAGPVRISLPALISASCGIAVYKDDISFSCL